MPLTAKWVQARRTEWGDAWVKECQKRALAGEPGWFYAIEAGYTIGTPFDHKLSGMVEWQQYAILAGCSGAWFMRAPAPAAADCTEPDRAKCPRRCQDFCNAAEERRNGAA